MQFADIDLYGHLPVGYLADVGCGFRIQVYFKRFLADLFDGAAPDEY
jgi:hypothetical protein